MPPKGPPLKTTAQSFLELRDNVVELKEGIRALKEDVAATREGVHGLQKEMHGNGSPENSVVWRLKELENVVNGFKAQTERSRKWFLGVAALVAADVVTKLPSILAWFHDNILEHYLSK